MKVIFADPYHPWWCYSIVEGDLIVDVRHKRNYKVARVTRIPITDSTANTRVILGHFYDLTPWRAPTGTEMFAIAAHELKRQGKKWVPAPTDHSNPASKPETQKAE